MYMSFVAVSRSLMIFIDVTYKMADWRPHWIFQFPDLNFILALNIKAKLKQHTAGEYW